MPIGSPFPMFTMLIRKLHHHERKFVHFTRALGKMGK